MTTQPLTVVGLMSGTSIDGIDAAIGDVHDDDDALVVRIVGYHEAPFEEALRRRVHALFDAESSTGDRASTPKEIPEERLPLWRRAMDCLDRLEKLTPDTPLCMIR